MGRLFCVLGTGKLCADMVSFKKIWADFNRPDTENDRVESC